MQSLQLRASRFFIVRGNEIAGSEAPCEITVCLHNQIQQSLPVARKMASGLHFVRCEEVWQVQIYSLSPATER